MRPDAKDADRGDNRWGKDGFSEWRALQRSTDKRRADIIADIVGHPQDAISVEELDYLNPELSDDSIRRHLGILQDVGVVESIEIPKGERLREYPFKFYTLTDDARELFDRNNLFPKEPWERQYAAVEKTPRIKEVEQMPRPSK